MKVLSFGGGIFFFAWRKGGVGERVVAYGIELVAACDKGTARGPGCGEGWG